MHADIATIEIPGCPTSTIVRIGADIARQVLPILLNYAAGEVGADKRRASFGDMPARLRAATAGGNHLEPMTQNLPHGIPASLENFWRVLCTFEEVALGQCIGDARPIRYSHPDDRFPRPWMLHRAAGAIEACAAAGDSRAAALLPLAKDWREIEQPPYRPI